MKILFYSPFSGIWKHAVADFQIKKSLARYAQVIDIDCDGFFAELCTVMNMKKLSLQSTKDEKQLVCLNCKKNSSITKHDKIFRFTPSKEIFYEKDVLALQNQIQHMNLSDLRNFHYLGVNIGKISLFETIIKYKKNDFNLKSEEINFYKIKVLHAAKSTLIAKEVISKFNPTHVVIFNPQYSIPGAFASYCEIHGIPVYGINFSYNFNEISRAVSIWNWNTFKLNSPALHKWKENRVESSKKEINRAKKHSLASSSANTSYAYSLKQSNRSAREFFGIPVNHKIVLLAMSSYDEMFANGSAGLTNFTAYESEVFSNQLEWVAETIKFFANQKDITLVIRPHPREFPNNRDTVLSAHVAEWQKVLLNLPGHIKLDVPDLKFSVYDYFDEIVAVITGWSSVGFEAMQNGIPCVSYDEKIVDFPKSIHFSGSSRDEYFQNITLAINNGPNNIISKEANEWFAFAFSRGTIRISGLLQDFKIFRFSHRTTWLAKYISFKLPSFSKKLETTFGKINRQDIKKLMDMLELSKDTLFEEKS